MRWILQRWRLKKVYSRVAMAELFPTILLFNIWCMQNLNHIYHMHACQPYIYIHDLFHGYLYRWESISCCSPFWTKQWSMPDLHKPGPSHKAKQLAWKYSKGVARIKVEIVTRYCIGYILMMWVFEPHWWIYDGFSVHALLLNMENCLRPWGFIVMFDVGRRHGMS